MHSCRFVHENALFMDKQYKKYGLVHENQDFMDRLMKKKIYKLWQTIYC